MPLEIGLWRVDAAEPTRVGSSGFPLESRLQGLIESDRRSWVSRCCNRPAGADCVRQVH